MKRAVILLLLAILSLIIIAPFAFFIQVRRNYVSDTLAEFLFGLAKAIDYLFGYLLFGVWGHTVSALTYHAFITKGSIGWFVSFINTLFNDPNHCKDQYEYEFNTGRR